MHRTKLGKLELLHASRIATFGLLGFVLLAASVSSILGSLTFGITYNGTKYSHVLDLNPVWDILLFVGGLLSIFIVINSLCKMERAQDRIIDMKLRSDEEAESILKYEYEDYKKESDLRFAISPILMLLSLVISSLTLDLWVNEVILVPAVSAAAFFVGVSLGVISVIDQIFLWNRIRSEREK